MGQRIKLTESQLHRIIEESVREVINENWKSTLRNMGLGAALMAGSLGAVGQNNYKQDFYQQNYQQHIKNSDNNYNDCVQIEGEHHKNQLYAERIAKIRANKFIEENNNNYKIVKIRYFYNQDTKKYKAILYLMHSQ